MHCYQINISGKVFKTGYRYFLKAAANRLEISGFVKYLSDHSVLVVSYGTEEQLCEFVNLCKTGNIDSKIDAVSVLEVPPKDFDSFEVVDDYPSDV